MNTMIERAVVTLLLSFTAVCAAGQAPDWAAGVAYAYDGSGNIKLIGDDHQVYDATGRLVQSDTNGTRRTFTYDAYGNRKTCADVAGDCQYGRTIDSATNRIAVAGYDASGNVTSLDGHTYMYDALNMQTRDATAAAVTEYVYTADDERIAIYRVTAGSWEWSVRDPSGKVLRDFTSRNQGTSLGTSQWAWVKDYVWRDGLLLATRRPGQSQPETYHYHLDHLGSPRQITNDANTIVGVHGYHAFGPETSTGRVDEPSATRIKYTGHERDGDTVPGVAALDYMHARYYSAGLGRFLSVDPVWASADIGKPQSWNRYLYVMNNPVNMVDPDGKAATLVTAGIGALTGAGFQIGINLISGDDWDKDVVKEMAIGAGLGLTGVGIVKVFDKGLDAYRVAKGAQATTQVATAATRNLAYETAAAGGKHWGTLKNYVGRPAAEIARGVRGHEKQVAIHLDKIANPAKHVKDWANLSQKHQQALIRDWHRDIQRNREMADVLRGLLDRM